MKCVSHAIRFDDFKLKIDLSYIYTNNMIRGQMS